jgi:hypothetical protein
MLTPVEEIGEERVGTEDGERGSMKDEVMLLKDVEEEEVLLL